MKTIQLTMLHSKAAFLTANITMSQEILTEKRFEHRELRQSIRDLQALQQECDLFPEQTEQLLETMRELSSEMRLQIRGIVQAIDELHTVLNRTWAEIEKLEEEMDNMNV